MVGVLVFVFFTCKYVNAHTGILFYRLSQAISLLAPGTLLGPFETTVSASSAGLNQHTSLATLSSAFPTFTPTGNVVQMQVPSQVALSVVCQQSLLPMPRSVRDLPIVMAAPE
jgi:hypothetical protein